MVIVFIRVGATGNLTVKADHGQHQDVGMISWREAVGTIVQRTVRAHAPRPAASVARSQRSRPLCRRPRNMPRWMLTISKTWS